MSTLTALHGLQIRNFKRHEDVTIDFGQKLTVIRGPNYSGKSSVLEAILFAFGGSTLVPGGRQVIVREGAKECIVDLSFTADGKKYAVQRTMKDAALALFSDVAGESEVIATGHTSVNAEIESLIGMPIKNWLVLSVSRQSSTAALMTLGASKLNEILEQISEADFIEKVVKGAHNREQRAAGALMPLPPPVDLAPLQENLKFTRGQIVDFKEAVENTEADLNKLNLRREELVKQIKQAKEHNAAINENEHERDRLNARLDLLEGELGNANDECEKLAPHKEEIAKIDEYRTEQKQLADSVASALVTNKQVQALDATIKAKREWLEGIGLRTLNAYKENAGQLATLKESVNTLHAKKAAAIALTGSADREYVDARKSVAAAICPACKRPFEKEQHEHAQAVVEQRKQAAEEAQRQECEIAAEYAQAVTAHNKLFETTPSATIVEVYPAREYDLKVALEERERLTPVNQADIQEWQSNAAELTITANKFAQMKWQLEQHTKKVTEGTERVNELRTKMAAILAKLEGAVIIAIDPMEDERTELYTQSEALSKTLSVNRVELGMMETNEKNLLQAIERTQETEKQRADLQRQLAAYSGLKKYLRENKTAFMIEMWDQLMSLASEFVSQVTEGDVNALGRDEDGDFWFEEGGTRRPILAASGGQRAIAGVGLALALSSLLPAGSRVLLLDEPSAELTDETAAALAGALKAQDRQIVLVTHREGEEFVSDSTIVLKR